MVASYQCCQCLCGVIELIILAAYLARSAATAQKIWVMGSINITKAKRAALAMPPFLSSTIQPRNTDLLLVQHLKACAH